MKIEKKIVEIEVFWFYFLVAQKILVAGEVLVVDTSCIVAMTNTVDFQIKYTGPIRRIVFGV